MEPIRIEYEERSYTICTAKGDNREVLIRTEGGTLIARLAPNGGNYNSEFQIRTDGQIISDNRIYGWIDNMRCTKKLAKILDLAVKEASGNDAQTLVKAHNLAKTLESVV